MPQSHLDLHLNPFDLHLHLSTNSLTILEMAQTSFGGFGPAKPTSTVDLTLYLFEHDVPPTLENGKLAAPIYRAQGHLLYQTAGRDSTLVVDQAQSRAFGYFSPAVIADETYFRWHFLHLAVLAMLKQHGLMGVHGAAVVKNGRAILLRAQSGGGKTTLAYASARQQFCALAEDVVWLDTRRNIWWGMPWHFHLLPDAKALFPELADFQPVWQSNGELKLEVELEDIHSDSTACRANPGPVVLVERAVGQRSRLEPLGVAQAWDLWQLGQTGTETEFPDYKNHITSLLKNNVYRLYFGDDIEAAVSLLAQL